MEYKQAWNKPSTWNHSSNIRTDGNSPRNAEISGAQERLHLGHDDKPIRMPGAAHRLVVLVDAVELACRELAGEVAVSDDQASHGEEGPRLGHVPVEGLRRGERVAGEWAGQRGRGSALQSARHTGTLLPGAHGDGREAGTAGTLTRCSALIRLTLRVTKSQEKTPIGRMSLS